MSVTRSLTPPFSFLRLLSHGQSGIHPNRRNTRTKTNQIPPQHENGPPRETNDNTGIDNVPPGIRQSFHGRDNGSDADGDAPADDHAFFGGVEETHGVEGCEVEVVDGGGAGCEGEGSCYDEGGNFSWKPL